MNILNRSGLTRRLALGLALIVSSSTQIVMLAGSDPAAAAFAAQKQSASSSSRDRAGQASQRSDDQGFTRRAEQKQSPRARSFELR